MSLRSSYLRQSRSSHRALLSTLLASAALTVGLFVPASAQLPSNEDLKNEAASVRVQSGTGSLKPADGYQVDIMARGLGQPSAILLADDGTIFVADTEQGRIFRLSDRNRDGEFETTQTLPARFDRPSGLVQDGRALIVADRSGVWRLPRAGTPQLIAPLGRSGTTGGPHPLARAENGALMLGLTSQDGQARIVQIAPSSGAATAIETHPGTLLGLAQFSKSGPAFRLWSERVRDEDSPSGVATASFIGRRLGAGIRLPRGTKAARLVRDRDGRERIIAATDEMIADLPIGLASAGVAEPRLTGLRAARLSLSAIAEDDRGLFFLDQSGGRLWRLTDAPTSGEDDQDDGILSLPGLSFNPDDILDPALGFAPDTPELLRGSGIDKASSLTAKPPVRRENEDEGPEPDQIKPDQIDPDQDRDLQDNEEKR